MTAGKKSFKFLASRLNFSWLWWVIASCVLAAIIVRPSFPAEWIVTMVIVAPSVWFVFAGPASLYYWQLNHRYSVTGWLVMALRLSAFLLVISYLTPRAVSTIEAWL